MGRTNVNKATGSLLQALAIILILFNTPPANAISKSNTDESPVLICLAPALAVSSREANTALPFSFSPLGIALLQETNWKLTIRLHASELLICSALKVPSTLYNVYYRVPRIHAP